MATDIAICNVALSRIGIDQLLESLDDPKASAIMCSLHLPMCRQEMLQDYAWPFASRTVALAVVADVEIPGWQFVYRYPVNCLKAKYVTDDQGGRVVRTIWNEAEFVPSARMAYDVMGDPDSEGARIICTDVEDAYLWYTHDVDDPNQMTALFRSALSWRLASELALGLRASGDMANYAKNQYLWAVSQAQAHSGNDVARDNKPMPESVTVRW